ncbi:cell wall hydrolase [Sphingomonas glacialis]|uniref:cell wall hydrolase n=1 Tax=Sphingomonas glacialis TaxID=658225 RepID=UPI001F502EC2|nr:cell wall hydrolase [Sphingomonas glacialis]
MTPVRSRSTLLRVIVVVIAVLAIVLPILLIRFAPPLVRHHVARSAPQRVVPAAELPPVEPVAFQDLEPDDARAFNASVPFVDGPNPAARPFKLAGDALERARAIDCLASAVLYEAGDEPIGQRAVAQVVINRARHPAFPKTICGVVFQGAERATGCQFTFTCDGALVRHHWLDVQWKRARDVATAALTGAVYKPVGYATHYHTNWVVPYWQSSLDKIAAVNTHLFFRWTGWWGTPPAFNRQVSPDEPIIAQLAPYSDAHKTGTDLIAGQPVLPEGTVDQTPMPTTAAATAPTLRPLASDPNTYLITLDPRMAADEYAELALKLCGDRPYCKVMGWSDASQTATAWPLLPAQMTTMSFSYLRDLRDAAHPFDRTVWKCAEFRRADPKQCMKE